MKTVTALALCSLLTGCCTGPEVIRVPVYNYVEPPALSMPVLQVDILPEHASTRDAVQALANDHRTMRSTLQQCIVILDGYRRGNQMDTLRVTEPDKQ